MLLILTIFAFWFSGSYAASFLTDALAMKQYVDLDSSLSIVDNTQIKYDVNNPLWNWLNLLVDPPTQAFSPSALGVFARANSETAVVYYNLGDAEDAPYHSTATQADYENPYIHVDTPFLAPRVRILTLVAMDWDGVNTNFLRSPQYVMNYTVEADDREKSYGFLVPGPETNGSFLRVGLEMEAKARAQSAGSQEFADFDNGKLRTGTYVNQIRRLHFPGIDPDIRAFEGGFPMNTTDGRQYGILVPFHNGEQFYGKVARVDLEGMDDMYNCERTWRKESLNMTTGELIVEGPSTTEEACVVILDLSTIHPYARGFRKGFAGYPYGYLSPGEYNVAVRLHIIDFTLAAAVAIDLNMVDPTYGGYSGGFVDGTWSCFNPFKTNTGSIGGIRSSLAVDANHLKVYYYAVILCINHTGWEAVWQDGVAVDRDYLKNAMRTIDLGALDPSLRGFSDVVRVGRFAYFAPMNTHTHTYSANMVRLNLGDFDIGRTVDAMNAAGLPVRVIVNSLDLTQKDGDLKGISSMFTAGKYLYCVPYRHTYEPKNGQRGYGKLARIDMNIFGVAGITVVDCTVTSRTQIPSFADLDLRGFSGGFASGKYGILIPFYNSIFSGKVARMQIFNDDDPNMNLDMQELDLTIDRDYPGEFKGFRGGFVSMWQGSYKQG